MNTMPWRAKLYIGIIELLAAIVIFNIIPFYNFKEQQLTGIMAFTGISIFSEYMAVTMPYMGTISVAYAIDIALILTFGVPIACLVAVIGYLGSCYLKRKEEEIILVKVVFNLAQLIITIYLSGIVYQYIMALSPGRTTHKILATALASIVYWIINTSVLTLLFAMLQKKSVWGMWSVNMRWAEPNFLALAPIGYILSYVYLDIGLLGLLIFIIPLLLARHTFKLYMDMRIMYLKSIQSLALTIDAKDHYTAGHSERVTQYVLAICEAMELPEEVTENLKDISILHDIGKISIPEHILNKPDRLTKDEFEIIKTHPMAGYEIVKQMTFLKWPEVIKYHHERYDGSGYPEGLCGDAIPLGARIIAVADAFDAMTTTRPYREGMTKLSALAELDRCIGTQFDPHVVAAFQKALPQFLEDQDAEKLTYENKVDEKYAV